MFVCVCNAVTDKQIVSNIEDGICSLRELTRCLGVGKDCGKCNKEVRSLLDQYASQNNDCRTSVLA